MFFFMLRIAEDFLKIKNAQNSKKFNDEPTKKEVERLFLSFNTDLFCRLRMPRH